MNSFSFTTPELKRLIWGSIWLAIAITAIIKAAEYYFLGTPLESGVIPRIGLSIFLVTASVGGLSKKAWTSQRLANWLDRPMVHGLWWGTLYTDYRVDDQQHPPIPIAFVIRQRYFLLSIQSFTKDIPSASTMESLIWDEKTSDTLLKYVFEMKRRANAENKFTTGYGELTLQDSGRRMTGHYWTNSPTQGRLELELVQRDCDSVNTFPAAELVWKKVKRIK